MEDANGVVVKEEYKGEYEVIEAGNKTRFIHRDSSYVSTYFARENEIFDGYFEVTFIKQLK